MSFLPSSLSGASSEVSLERSATNNQMKRTGTPNKTGQKSFLDSLLRSHQIFNVL